MALEVQIGADKTDFDKKIKEIEFDIRELSKVKLDKLKLGLDTTTINAQIKDAKNSLNGLKTSLKDTGNAVSGMTPKVANGSNALMQFSRIAQDAPYGIIGIGNNITATAEAFSYLKQSTGSTGGALKALASSLMGTGGILLGVSLLTTGLTLLSQSGLSVGDIIDKITGKFDAFGQTITKISVDAAKNSGQEVSNMNALVSVAQDDLKSRKDRLTAVQELQNQFPAYFGNLSTEKILNGDLTSITKELTKAIIARAEASAIADKIGELASKKLDLQIKREKAILDLQRAQAGLKNKITVTGGTMGAVGLSDESRLATTTSRVKDLNQGIYDIQLQQDKLAGRLNQKTSDSIKLLEKKATISKKPEKAYSTPQVSGLGTSIAPAGLADTTSIAVFTGATDQFGNKIKELPGIIKTSMGEAKIAVDTGGIALLEAMKAFNDSANELITTSISDTFSNLGTAIGEALATGGNVFQAIGNTILSGIGSFLSEMGGLLIKYGTLAVLKGKLDLAILTGGPVAIVAGVAAIAVGIALKAAGGAIGSAASGGGQKSGGSVQGGNSYTSPSSSSGGGGSSFQGGTVVFEISGQSLVGVLSNTLDKNKRLGGALAF